MVDVKNKIHGKPKCKHPGCTCDAILKISDIVNGEEITKTYTWDVLDIKFLYTCLSYIFIIEDRHLFRFMGDKFNDIETIVIDYLSTNILDSFDKSAAATLHHNFSNFFRAAMKQFIVNLNAGIIQEILVESN